MPSRPKALLSISLLVLLNMAGCTDTSSPSTASGTPTAQRQGPAVTQPEPTQTPPPSQRQRPRRSQTLRRHRHQSQLPQQPLNIQLRHRGAYAHSNPGADAVTDPNADVNASGHRRAHTCTPHCLRRQRCLLPPHPHRQRQRQRNRQRCDGASPWRPNTAARNTTTPAFTS